MSTPWSEIEFVVRHISAEAEDLYHQVFHSGQVSVNGQTSPQDIAAASALEHLGFVFRRMSPAGYDLLPTPFEVLIPSLLHRLDWLYPPFRDMPDGDRQQLRNLLTALAKGALGPLPPPLLPDMSRTLEGGAEIDAFVTGILRDTERVCAISAAEWSTNLPLVWAALTQRMQEGMRYYRIVSPLGLAAFGWDINDRDIRETGVHLRVSLGQTLTPFYLFKSTTLSSALVFVSQTKNDTQPRASYTALGQLTERLSAIFEDLWQDAVPARSILDYLESYRNEYITRARTTSGDDGARVASVLFNRGVFAEFDTKDLTILRSLAAADLAIRSKYVIGLTEYVPNIMQEITRKLQEERRRYDEPII